MTENKSDNPKECVFKGTADQCQYFIRANRFSVRLHGMELQSNDTEVWAWVI